MSDVYFDIPVYSSLARNDGWVKVDKHRTRFFVARCFFQLKVRHLPGPVSIGRKISVIGAPKGMSMDRFKAIEVDTDVFCQAETIQKSLFESGVSNKIVSSLKSAFGRDDVAKASLGLSTEVSEQIKSTFETQFNVTESVRNRKSVKYEFKDSVGVDFDDSACAVAAYQRCTADLYLLKLDYLNIIYDRTFFGLRKRLGKYPFPADDKEHPNIIKLGIPLATLEFWELLPESSLVVRDTDYAPVVSDDSEIVVKPARDLKFRPYWNYPKTPTLYQLSRVAFPIRWIDVPNNDLSKDELMQIELGEAVESGWGARHYWKNG